MAPLLNQLTFLLPLLNTSARIDAWLAVEEPRALRGILNNIGPRFPGAARGIVVASPSLEDPATRQPDYGSYDFMSTVFKLLTAGPLLLCWTVFTWTRDAALVSKAILDKATGAADEHETSQPVEEATKSEFESGPEAEPVVDQPELVSVVEDYAEAQAELQEVDNPSGAAESGGLGEPKFNIDLSAFEGEWGRPQRDGPALRAITLIGYSNYLLANGQEDKVRTQLAPIILRDLDYVATYWNETGFDLWEEVKGSSFFTTAVQHRALVEGYDFTAKLNGGKGDPVLKNAAGQVLCFLQTYWKQDDKGGFIVSNLNQQWDAERSGLDANSILASTHNFDSSATSCSSITFQPCSDRALANLKAIVDAFRPLYPLNSNLPAKVPADSAASKAVALGRYPEDVYFGGNPWILTTMAAAEQLYKAGYTWDKAGEVNITETSLGFWRDLVGEKAEVGTYKKGSGEYEEMMRRVRDYADGFVAIVEAFTPADGSQAEQFDRTTGEHLSARDLTWSYASIVTAAAARKGEAPPMWESELVEPKCEPAKDDPTVKLTFKVLANTAFGESLVVVGSLPTLGKWDPATGLALAPGEYSAAHPEWVGTFDVPAAYKGEFKLVKLGQRGQAVWEGGENRRFTTQEEGEQVIEVEWQG